MVKFIAGATAAFVAGSSFGQVTFLVEFDDPAGQLAPWQAAIESHIITAGQLWIAELDVVPVTLTVDVAPSATIPRATGRSVTSSFVGTSGDFNVFEQGAAAEIRTGVDPNGLAQPDIEIRLNIGYVGGELWFDPDPVARTTAVPFSRTDAMSVFTHELGHAFAYNGWINGFNGTYPGNFMSTFDRWVIFGGSTFFFLGPETMAVHALAPDITFGNPSHWGNSPGATGPHDHGAPNLEGAIPTPPGHGVPPSAEPPDALGGGGLIDELMNGVVFFRGSRYFISNLDRAVLLDVGLDLTTCIPDIMPNGAIDFDDLALLLAEWGICADPCRADLRRSDNRVDGQDLDVLLDAWGGCP